VSDWYPAWHQVRGLDYDAAFASVFAFGCACGHSLELRPGEGEECCLTCDRCYRAALTFEVREPAWVDASRSMRPILRPDPPSQSPPPSPLTRANGAESGPRSPLHPQKRPESETSSPPSPRPAGPAHEGAGGGGR
jgi:hypothetical protein